VWNFFFMKRNIILFAGGEIGIRSLKCLYQLHYAGEINLKVCPSGFDKSTNEIIAKHGKHFEVPVFDKPSNFLLEKDVWIVFSAGNGFLFKREYIDKSTNGIINFHAAPLPEFRGSATPAFAILNEKSEFGITFHMVSEKLDAGPIIHKETFPISPEMTSQEVDNLCINKGEEALSKYAKLWIDLKFQLKENSTIHLPYKRSALESFRKIDLSWSQEKIWNHIRAFDWEAVLNPAYLELGNRRVHLLSRPRGKKGLD
jgi:methionyl-tRNA formyltransferase